jgi:UDP-2,3-diacylglucosamine hydrolase
VADQLFISDLHLSADRPDVTQRFLGFLDEHARRGTRLYILGDLFDTWIGDDCQDETSDRISAALRHASSKGLAVFLQHGNRDFLLGDAFCQRSGVQLIQDTHCVDLFGQQALLMHGDLLCSDDQDYQQARQLLRSPAFIADFLGKPIQQRRLLADEYRRRSGEATSLKAMDIMDVNANSVHQQMHQHGASLLIHGHTHRPQRHQLLEGKQRFVLGDWSSRGALYLRVGPEGAELTPYPVHYR